MLFSAMAYALEQGEVLRNKYRVERVLGSGGMGTVVLATHLKMMQLVAIKLLLPETRDMPDVVLRFAREARAASRLKSAHAVRILDVDESESGEPFIVMEFLEGTDLHQHVEKAGPLPIQTAVTYVLQACEGLAEAHAAGIIHRDLKPANLFLTTGADGAPLVKILDFGISKAIEGEGTGEHLITAPASVMGSPSYMSPEQIKNAASVDVRTDIWSLGVVLHQLLTGALPFRATNIASLAARITVDPPEPVRTLRADTPPDLERVILRCMEKDPAARFADVTELARALGPFAPAGSVAALRVARTAETRRAVEAPAPSPASIGRGGGGAVNPGQETQDLDGASHPSAAGLATASIHGSGTPALEKLLSTEYASTVGHSAPPPAIKKSRRAISGLVVVALGLSIGAAFAIANRTATPSATEAPSSASPTHESPTADSRALASTADSTAFAPSPPSSAHAARDAGTDASMPGPRPASSGGAAPVVPPRPKNPMDIDFR